MRIRDWSSDVFSSDLVDGPEVEGRPAAFHPLRQRLAGAAGRLDADRIEAGGDVEVGQLRRLAQQVAVVGREALRAVEEGVDAGALQQRQALHRGLEARLEVVEVLRELRSEEHKSELQSLLRTSHAVI